MTWVPQDTSAEEPDDGNLHVRFRGGPGQGDPPGLLNNTPAPTPPRTTMNRSSPRGLTADIILRLKRCPVTRTTGVWPFGAQVVPL